jgi:hypothetical protein
MKQTTPPLDKHAEHNIEIRLFTGSKHSACYYCTDCNKFIAWLSHSETKQASKLGLISANPMKPKKELIRD